MNSKELTIRIAVFLIGSVGIGLLARRKNHNPWLWGAIGGVSAAVIPLLIVVPLLIVGFLKHKCSKCGASVSNAEAKTGVCHACQSRAAGGSTSGAV